MAENINWITPEPNPKQKAIIDYIGSRKPGSYATIGYGGEAGSGKTWLLGFLPIILSLKYPGIRGVVGAKTLKTLEGQAKKEFLELIPPEIVNSKFEIFRYDTAKDIAYIRLPQWPAGLYSEVWFRPLASEDTIQGDSYGYVIIDEASSVPAKVANQLFLRLRQKSRDPANQWPLVYFCCSNPHPGWFNDLFHKKRFNEELLAEAQAEVKFFHALASDNEANLPPGYTNFNRAMLSDNYRKRFVDGSYTAIEGAIFPEFLPDMHQWVAAELPAFEYVVGALDFGGIKGDSHPSAGIVRGVMKTGRSIVLDAFKKNGPNVTMEQAEWCRQMDRKWGKKGKILWIADGTQTAGIQLLKHVYRLNIRYNQRHKDSWRNNVAAVRQKLLPDSERIPGAPKIPALFYLPHLREFENEMMEYQYDDRPLPDGSYRERPKKVNDDLIDCLLYTEEAPHISERDFDVADLTRFRLPRIA